MGSGAILALMELTFEQAEDLVRYFLGPGWEPVELAAQLFGNANKLVISKSTSPFARPAITWEEAFQKVAVSLPVK